MLINLHKMLLSPDTTDSSGSSNSGSGGTDTSQAATETKVAAETTTTTTPPAKGQIQELPMPESLKGTKIDFNEIEAPELPTDDLDEDSGLKVSDNFKKAAAQQKKEDLD